jgi:hypothetical protein
LHSGGGEVPTRADFIWVNAADREVCPFLTSAEIDVQTDAAAAALAFTVAGLPDF